MTGHTQDDRRCPARDKECRKCHKVGHFAKCCKTKKVKDPNDKKLRPKKPRDTKRSVNLINSKDSPGSKYAFTIVDEKQPMVQVKVGGVLTLP